MDNDYSQITWPEVRAGDVLLHENGDRLTVEISAGEGGRIHAAKMARWREGWDNAGFSPYRRKPELPTTPGAYLDKDGDYWLLDRAGNWYDWSSLSEPNPRGGSADAFAPFTRLVPMPTEEQVYEAIDLATSERVIGEVQSAAAAVMTLLTGKEADSE